MIHPLNFNKKKHKIKISVIEFLRTPHQFHKKQERKRIKGKLIASLNKNAELCPMNHQYSNTDEKEHQII